MSVWLYCQDLPQSGQFNGTKRDAQVALDLLVEAHDGVHSAASGALSELLERWYEIASLD